jgi:hypothetical protein
MDDVQRDDDSGVIDPSLADDALPEEVESTEVLAELEDEEGALMEDDEEEEGFGTDGEEADEAM